MSGQPHFPFYPSYNVEVSQKLANSFPLTSNPEKPIVTKGGWRGPAVLRLWHLSSLDAPTVAVVWSVGFAWAIGVRLPVWSPLLLALVAWASYIGDRLLDARAGLRTPPEHQLRERHYFHWRHRYIFGAIASGALISSAWMVYKLIPAGARVPDSAFAAAAFAYVSGIHSRRKLPALVERFVLPFVTREFLIAVFFTAACLLPIWSKPAPGGTTAFGLLVMPALYFTALAWLNCHAIGRWETDTGGHDEKRPANRVGLAASIVAGSGLFLAAWQASAAPRVAVLIIAGAGSAFLLGALETLRPRLSALALRAAADLILLTPALVLALSLLKRW